MKPEKKSLTNWKRHWDERVQLLSLKEEKRDYEEILDLLNQGRRRRQKLKPETLHRYHLRVKKDIENLIAAADHDKKQELFRWVDIRRGIQLNGIDAESLQEDQENVWERIACAMPDGEREGRWTAEKVRYAWENGASCRSRFQLDPVQWTQKLSEEVNQAMIELYPQN